MNYKVIVLFFALILFFSGFSSVHAQFDPGSGSGFSHGGGASAYGHSSYEQTTFYGNSERGVAQYNSYYDQPDFQTYYREERRLETYYPILDNPASCEAREDIILQVSPVGGCQPAVVRSDLLAEQNVPVFCQIEAIKVNPLLDIKEIRNIRFRGDYPEEVVGTGFHPSRAALRTNNRLLGSPIVNNIGNIVVVLKQQPNEEKLPDLVNFTLSAQLDYQADNALGVGRASFLLEEQTEDQWQTHKPQQGFWQGRFFLRLEDATHDFATIAIYEGDFKVASVQVQKGKTSNVIHLPGSYCQYGVRLAYDGFQSTDAIAKLKVGDDVLDVHRGSRFLNNKCVVRDVIGGDVGDGRVDVQCSGERFTLSIGARNDSAAVIQDIDATLLEPYYSDQITTFGDLTEVESLNDLVIVNVSNELHLFGFVEQIQEENETLVRLYDNSGTVLATESPEIILSEKNIVLSSITGFDGSLGLIERLFDEQTEQYFAETITTYEQIADDYPLEKPIDLEGSETYGEQALASAIELASDYGKQETQARLINRFLDLYPNSVRASGYVQILNELQARDFSKASAIIDLDNDLTTLRLIGVRNPSETAQASFFWDTKELDVPFGESRGFDFGDIALERVEVDKVRVVPTCNEGDNEAVQKTPVDLVIGESGTTVCGKVLTLRKVDLQETAQVRLIPSINNGQVETNFSVGIGIEKRAIELTPEKAKKKADDLDEVIKKWEDVSKNLGNVVSGLKSACFATSAVLTVKNFFDGLDGEAVARQKVMNDHWRGECQRLIALGEYDSPSACYYGERDKINSDVQHVQQLLQAFDQEVETIEGQHSSTAEGFGGIFGGASYVDGNATSSALISTMQTEDYWNEPIVDTEGTSYGTPAELLDATSGHDRGDYNYQHIRDMRFNLDIIHSDAPEHLRLAAQNRLSTIAETIKDNRAISERFEQAQSLAAEGFAEAAFVGATGQRNRVLDVVQIQGNQKLETYGWNNETTHSSTFVTNGFTDSENNIDIPAGEYVVGLRSTRGNIDEYSVVDVFNLQTGERVNTGEFNRVFNVGLVTPTDQVSYNNKYLNPEIRFYETEPYKGLPAIVPFDTSKGWYAATRQTLQGFGNIGSFESNGRVASFFLCNVGKNGREQFFEGIGDDQCQLINLNTGQPLDAFPGLTEQEAQILVNRAVQALQQAAQQYGDGRNHFVIDGETLSVGMPAANSPGTECAEFMSPEECNILFNVCDPVVCPSSRCDLGGTYPVADVIQTGIVGSALLCLPNYQEGIAIPVCLSGIHAGIDSYLSILKSQQACLREQAENGNLVGICDEITSVYTCEFFWRQVAPATNVLVPKLFEALQGNNAPRGGGEYITVQNAWDNTQGSIDYFTNNYAVNSLDAFNVRSTEAAGSTFCRAFIGGKGINAFENLVTPDSPSQFYAWFSSTPFSDVTVPVTAQYKVFYHIFAGNDEGVSYSVYLKDPPQTSYYQTTPTIQVHHGFIPRGEFASETVDFTAPEGYQQLCVRVNGEEQCGFKQVSTDFAVNYLRDSYVQDELTRTDITSEQACISGSPDPRTLLNPNLQAGVEETVFPEVYNRGIIRICSTENPGSATNPTRFADVGHCGDEQLRCWLDKESVDNAITSNNLAARNETLSEIRDTQLQNLEQQGEILPDGVIDDRIANLSDQVTRYDGSSIDAGNRLVDSISLVFDKTFFNDQKANLILLQGNVFEKIFVHLAGTISVKDNGEPVVSTDDGTESETESEQETEEENTPSTYELSSVDYIVNGTPVTQASVFDDIQLRIVHDCDYVNLAISFEGDTFLDENEITEKTIVRDLDSTSGRYVSAVECWDEPNNRRVGDRIIESLDVAVEIIDPLP